MSVEAMTWAFSVPLPPCPKSILVALANRADEDGRCWPGVADLERRTGWSRRAVQQGVRYLMEVDLLVLEERYRASGRQESNLYCLLVGATPKPLEGAAGARGRVQQVRGEGAAGARGRVQQVRGEGAAGAPESSSESSSEQSLESPPNPPTGGACAERPSTAEEEFDRFWAAYPSKVGKKKALVAWRKAMDRPGIEAVLQAIELAKNGERWQRGIIPNPATWLNQGRWADVVPGLVKVPSDPLPKAFTTVAGRSVQGDECPPEVAAILGRILHGNAHSFPADQQGAA